MSQPDWSLRLAKPDDAQFLPDIERAAGQLFRDDPDLAEIDINDVLSVDEHHRFMRRGHCLTALVGERIVGFLTAEPVRRELHIWELSVHPDCQQRGVGAGLVRACQIDARNSGFRAITLTTFRDNAWNGPFYQRMGFTEVSDFEAHPRLASELENEAKSGLPRERRCAMIHFLD